MDNNKLTADLLVVGGGIAGMTAALETAETGYSVILLEKKPYLGGRVVQFNHYFPKLCPPTCGLEINVKRLTESSNINYFTQAEPVAIEGESGDYKTKVKIKPRYLKDASDQEAIEECSKNCPVEIDNDFDYGLSKKKAVNLPYNNAFPMRYTFDKDELTEEQIKEVSSSCGDCIDTNQSEETVEINTKAIVFATGWNPYDAKNLDYLSYGKEPNVITNVEMERLAAPNGPTEGKIVIPGMDKELKKVAFVQCAGSRDENHLEYCSTVCCLASMKQARYLREQYPDAEIHIFYIDLRAPGALEDFYSDTKEDEKIFWHRGKVAKVFKDYESQDLIVEAEDTMAGELKQKAVDMAVLATGMQPTLALNGALLDKSTMDENGFIRTDLSDSIIGCGTATGPKDVASCVQEATGAALKAIQIIKRSS